MTIEENGLKDSGTFILPLEDFSAGGSVPHSMSGKQDRCDGRVVITVGKRHAG